MWDQPLGESDVVIFDENDPQLIPYLFVRRRFLCKTVDKRNYPLGVRVSARRFRPEDKGLGRKFHIGVGFEFDIVTYDFKDVEKLTLVLVQSLDLGVETRTRVDFFARFL